LPSPELYNEKQLLLQIAQGDQTAFASLFYTHHQKLGEYIFRLSGSYELAQEIVQDIFLKIWKHRADLVQIEHFGAYLFVISRNHAFNCLKQVARERERKQEWLRYNKEVLYTERETDNLYQQYHSFLEEAIEKLPPRQKAVYLLSQQEGLSYEEIASRLHLSFETVKKHKSLALQFIRRQVRLRKDIILPTVLFFLHFH
jgi:RNA polymerase sigma-70 factor (family 1)